MTFFWGKYIAKYWKILENHRGKDYLNVYCRLRVATTIVFKLKLSFCCGLGLL